MKRKIFYQPNKVLKYTAKLQELMQRTVTPGGEVVKFEKILMKKQNYKSKFWCYACQKIGQYVTNFQIKKEKKGIKI